MSDPPPLPPKQGPYTSRHQMPQCFPMFGYTFCFVTEKRNACDEEDRGTLGTNKGEDQATSVYPPAIYCPDFIITKVFVFPSHASWNSFATFVLVGWSLVLKSLVAFVNCDSRDERKLNGNSVLKSKLLNIGAFNKLMYQFER